MFERFTHEARAAVMQAVDRAAAARSSHVEPTHILLGVAAGDSSAARILAEVGATAEALAEAARKWDDAHLLGTLGIDIEQVRATVERVFGPNAWMAGEPPARRRRRLALEPPIPFSADAKKSLELALREALALRSKRLEAGHLLLGLLRTGGAVCEALAAVGAEPPDLRRRMVETLRQAS